MLDDIILFIKLYETKSFKKCADALNIKPSTLSKRINQLESQLNNKLIIRAPNSFKPTEYGDFIYNNFKYIPIFTEKTLDAYRADQQNSATGTLNIALGSAISYELISSQIGKFLDENPSVNLNINFETNLNRMPPNTDIALTAKHVNDDNLDNRFIRSEKIRLFCSKEYALKYGVPTTPEDLTHHRVIGGLNIDNIPIDHLIFKNIKNNNEVLVGGTNWQLKANSPMHLKKIGMSANYIFGAHDSICYKEVLDGDLILVLPEWYLLNLDFYIVTRKQLTELEHIFVNFMSNCLSLSYNNIMTNFK